VSDCEPFHVNKATPSISTVVKDGNNATVDNDTHKAALGVTVHDTATLADGVTGFSFDGTATVTYKLFSNLSCTAGTNDANLLVSGNKTVAATGSVPDSNAFGPLGSGDYSYQATYNGNGNYNSATAACEPFHVNKATPSVPTTLKNGDTAATDNNTTSAALGSTAHDTAALGGKVDSLSFDGTDTVTYHFFANGTCTGDPLDTDTVTVASDTVPKSKTESNLAAGHYAFNATYNGNANYTAKTSDCEPFDVNKATPSISTAVKDANNATVDNDTHNAALGVTVHDTAALADGVGGFSFDGTATVTYKLFSNLSCTSEKHTSKLLSSGHKTVTPPPTVPDSNAFGPLGSGDYSYQATYNGNGNYNSATRACEPFHVNKATLSISTFVNHRNLHSFPTRRSSDLLGVTVHDTAALADGVTGFSFDGTATVTYKLFSNLSC